MEDIKEKILKEYEKGNIVFSGIEGLQVAKLYEFIQQPTDGILYDLNRNEVVVLSFLNDSKWINDYAVSKTITALKQKIEELEKQATNNNIGDVEILLKGLENIGRWDEEEERWADPGDCAMDTLTQYRYSITKNNKK
ncbi:hypothetical protein COY27_04745 [Candidatus Woesearchaeota archaeon CG_4_10_14_0_2_um_filter_33_13]|nr:MAG: hypothetical protein COY27_04745 [Candidatus Woesearchaeota archaeon CG_4_10_14_0_2_um_filter_33_13]